MAAPFESQWPDLPEIPTSPRGPITTLRFNSYLIGLFLDMADLLSTRLETLIDGREFCLHELSSHGIDSVMRNLVFICPIDPVDYGPGYRVVSNTVIESGDGSELSVSDWFLDKSTQRITWQQGHLETNEKNRWVLSAAHPPIIAAKHDLLTVSSGPEYFALPFPELPPDNLIEVDDAYMQACRVDADLESLTPANEVDRLYGTHLTLGSNRIC